MIVVLIGQKIGKLLSTKAKHIFTSWLIKSTATIYPKDMCEYRSSKSYVKECLQLLYSEYFQTINNWKIYLQENEWMIAYPNNKILHTYKKEWSPDIQNDMD